MIFMLCGTSDARELAVQIKAQGYSVLTSVVTDSAAGSLKEAGLDVRVGRLTADEMAAYLKGNQVQAVVDASHPFAEEAHRNAMAAAEQASVPYIRYERESLTFDGQPLIQYADDYAEAAEMAAAKGGVVMLTTGSKTLQVFTERLLGLPNVTLIARMLPRLDNMEKCDALGLPQKHIVAMQGPFSKALNRALYEQFGVTLMITKESGKVGSVDEKLEAALEMGIETIIIGRPKLAYGHVFSRFDEISDTLKEMLS
ncbi:precorrin-6A reductase [Paenibacillus sp. FSL H8-0537]|uniref:precorrin-6A reductase n=1 Tax=Paenibacillus sp. FSL H8-0537 TaxID=2921399 RepID=UPI00310178CE